MIKMVNQYGNVYVTAATERKAQRLEALGYKRVEDEPQQGYNLDKMKVSDLEQFASERNIDLSGCANKEEKLAKIKAEITA